MSEQRKPGGFELRRRVEALLRSDDFFKRLAEWRAFMPRQVINPLLSFLYSADEIIKWRAVSAVGIVMARMADQEMEAAREIMRRLIWNLNDESGGIGWGSAEAMGEITARHERLACEYGNLLVCFIRPDGTSLENPLLERGVLWGLGRLAQARPVMLECAAPFFYPYLKSDDSYHRGLAARALGFLKPAGSRSVIEPLLKDRAVIRVFENEKLGEFRICDLAGRALESNS